MGRVASLHLTCSVQYQLILTAKYSITTSVLRLIVIQLLFYGYFMSSLLWLKHYHKAYFLLVTFVYA